MTTEPQTLLHAVSASREAQTFGNLFADIATAVEFSISHHEQFGLFCRDVLSIQAPGVITLARADEFVSMLATWLFAGATMTVVQELSTEESLALLMKALHDIMPQEAQRP